MQFSHYGSQVTESKNIFLPEKNKSGENSIVNFLTECNNSFVIINSNQVLDIKRILLHFQIQRDSWNISMEMIAYCIVINNELAYKIWKTLLVTSKF